MPKTTEQSVKTRAAKKKGRQPTKRDAPLLSMPAEYREKKRPRDSIHGSATDLHGVGFGDDLLQMRLGSSLKKACPGPPIPRPLQPRRIDPRINPWDD